MKSPNIQLGRVYKVAVKGTQQTRKSISVLARLTEEKQKMFTKTMSSK